VKAKKDKWTGESPYERFFDFIAPRAERLQILLEHAKTLKLNAFVANIAGNKHFFIFPSGQNLASEIARNPASMPFKGQSPVMLVAHYDRVKDSPGANDNSIAVFQLLKAGTILDARGADNWIIVFTDKEELASGEGIFSQGSFTLSQKLRLWGLENCKIYIFDACGIGETLIISSTTDYILTNRNSDMHKTKQLIRSLRNRALMVAQSLNLKKILLAPVPFSDDVGFLTGGLAAQTITTLPALEADLYEAFLRNNPGFTDTLIAGSAKNSVERRSIPQTWRSLNSAADCPSKLTPQYFDQVVNLAVELALTPGA